MTIPPEQPIQRYLTCSGGSDLAGFWVDALGWIACYFAQLEGLSYAIVDLLGSAHDKKSLAKLPYQKRTDHAKTLICAHLRALGKVELASEWAALLNEIKAAAPLRNKILHNPLGINMATLSSMEDPEQGIVLVTLPGRPKIKLGAVQAFCQHVISLNKRMLNLQQRTGL